MSTRDVARAALEQLTEVLGARQGTGTPLTLLATLKLHETLYWHSCPIGHPHVQSKEVSQG